MKRVKILYYCSVLALIAVGILFVKANRDVKAVGVMESLKDKNIVFYSSNYKKTYINSKDTNLAYMNTLCMEGVKYLKDGGLNASHFIIEQGDADPYTQSGLYLKKYLSPDSKYILIDISRSTTRYGTKCDVGGKTCCPINILLSKKSVCYDNSLLVSGRIKSYIEQKYKSIPVHIITVEDKDYNQSMGYIGMMVDVGDSANTYDEALESMRIFSKALIEIVNAAG